MAAADIKRGDIFYADLSPVVGSEQGGMRPVLIIQNNVGNHYSPTVIVAAITAKVQKTKMPTHININAAHTGIEKNSVVLLEQVRTIDKQRLKDRVTHLDEQTMQRVDGALLISIGLADRAKHRPRRTVPR
ncbi:type II toxin-antitoxin system PemK/MazF family toxin [Lactiplantibacillus daowaiensis]|uniref:mRNA interferase n=1 Tax=Lactiplantibacillus daowaiensis TaxID=2559918 RepID=A0ABW1S4E6_9LACO|nr:type II toxin-antitoxin system PemK/MazF family toxin [Lactiplantibacillus daowaiensis]